MRREVSRPAVATRAQETSVSSPREGELPAGRRPDSMIPRSWLVLIACGFAGLLVWSGILWLGLADWPARQGLGDLVSLQGPLPRFFSTLALLATAQLSFLILWHRSRSRKDFMGRYRIWGWAGAFWGITCISVATDIHLPAARLACRLWPVNCWHPETMYWLAPLATGVLSLYRLLGREMRHSRASSVAWNVAFGLGVLAGAMQFGLGNGLPARWRIATAVGLTMLWHFSLALTFLLHARFVTHVTNEAAPKVPSLSYRVGLALFRLLSLLGSRLLRIRLPRVSWKTPRWRWGARPATATALLRNEQPGKKQTPSAKPVDVPAVPISREEPVPPQRSRVLGQQVRIDPPASPSEIKPPHAAMGSKQPAGKSGGAQTAPLRPPAEPDDDDQDEFTPGSPITGSSVLSKSERKRLKKLQRQQSRVR